MDTILDLETKFLKLSQTPKSNFVGLMDIFRSALITYYYSKMFKFAISRNYLERLKSLVKNSQRLLEKDYRWSIGDYDNLGNDIKRAMKLYKRQYKTYTLPVALTYITNQLDLSNNEFVYTPATNDLLLYPTTSTTYYNTAPTASMTSPKDQYMFILNKISSLLNSQNKIDFGLIYSTEDSLTISDLQLAYQALQQNVGLNNPLYQFKKELLDKLISNINALATSLMTVLPGRNFTATNIPIKILLSDALNYSQSIYNQNVIYV
jgi:hypothetical protein